MTTRVVTECLNDLMDYFVLTDIDALTAYQADYGLAPDLCAAFTMTDHGDAAVEAGVILPLRGIANYPYTIIFQVDSGSIFGRREHDLQHERHGYKLHVTGGAVHLLTMPNLRQWPQNRALVEELRPRMALSPGWYLVIVRAGETLQATGWEPTIEFEFLASEHEPVFDADLEHAFAVKAREY